MNEQDLLDSKRFIGKVAEKHGILLDEKEPAFYVASLNRYVLEDAVHVILESVERARSDFESTAERVQRTGLFLAERLKESSRIGKHEEEASARAPAIEWIGVGILAALLIFAAGVLVGLKWYQAW